jgi:hypothetical protein
MRIRAIFVALALGVPATPAWGEIAYVGSSTIGDYIVPDVFEKLGDRVTRLLAD